MQLCEKGVHVVGINENGRDGLFFHLLTSKHLYINYIFNSSTQAPIPIHPTSPIKYNGLYNKIGRLSFIVQKHIQITYFGFRPKQIQNASIIRAGK